MSCTESYKEHILYTFNGFCKTVIRFAAINAWRDRDKRRQREIFLNTHKRESCSRFVLSAGEKEGNHLPNVMMLGSKAPEIEVSDSKPTVVHNLSFPAILLLKEQKEESVSECTLQP